MYLLAGTEPICAEKADRTNRHFDGPSFAIKGRKPEKATKTEKYYICRANYNQNSTGQFAIFTIGIVKILVYNQWLEEKVLLALFCMVLQGEKTDRCGT